MTEIEAGRVYPVDVRAPTFESGLLLHHLLHRVASSRGAIKRVYLCSDEYRAIKRAAGVGLRERDQTTGLERRVCLAGAFVYRLSEIDA